MSTHTALTIAAALVAWGLVSLGFALSLGRIIRAASIPASPEPDEHEACHGDPEALRSISQSGVICHFHTTHEEASK